MGKGQGPTGSPPRGPRPATRGAAYVISDGGTADNAARSAVGQPVGSPPPACPPFARQVARRRGRGPVRTERVLFANCLDRQEQPTPRGRVGVPAPRRAWNDDTGPVSGPALRDASSRKLLWLRQLFGLDRPPGPTYGAQAKAPCLPPQGGTSCRTLDQPTSHLAHH